MLILLCPVRNTGVGQSIYLHFFQQVHTWEKKKKHLHIYIASNHLTQNSHLPQLKAKFLGA